MDLEPITYVMIFLYIGGILAIGWWSISRVHSMRDYLIAGQSMGRWLVSFGVVASIVSGAGLLGNAGAGYGIGYPLYVMTMGLSFLGLTLAFFLLAKPMTVLASRHPVYTLPDVLALRYANSNAVRILSALAVMLGSFIYLVVQFVAMAYVGTTIFGLSLGAAVLLSGLLIGLYTIGGGIMAAMWTNLFQMVVLGLFAIGIAIWSVARVGGLTELHDRLSTSNPEMLEPWASSGAFVWQNVLVYAFFVGLLAYAGVPHINTKFLTIKSLDVIRWIPLISCFLYLFATATLWAGMSYLVMEQDGQVPAPSEPDAVLPLMVSETFGPVLVGIMVAAVLAAVMSTSESFVVLSAAALVRDIGKNGLGMRFTDTQELLATRVFGVVILVGAGLMAMNPPEFVLALMAVAWGALAAMLGPVLYVGLRWRRATSQGAVAALVVGIAIGGVAGLLNQTVFADDRLFAPWNVGAIGVIGAYLAIITVSLLTKPQRSEVFSHFAPSAAEEAAQDVPVVR